VVDFPSLDGGGLTRILGVKLDCESLGDLRRDGVEIRCEWACTEVNDLMSEAGGLRRSLGVRMVTRVVELVFSPMIVEY
jgi:hypothetical protein